MDIESPEVKAYLQQLHQQTAGKIDAQVSMFDVGSAIGLDKEASGKTAEDLIGHGLAEVKTLSGGIGITTKGVEAAQSDGASAVGSTADASLNDGPLLDDTGRGALDPVLSDLQTHIAELKPGYDRLEELVFDMRTLQIQLHSPRAKTAIVKAVLASIQDALKAAGSQQMATRLDRLINP